MNKLSVLALALLTAVSTASAQTPASTPSRVKFYAQPSVVVAFPGDFDVAAGGALALGVTVADRHSIEAEVIQFKSGYQNVDVTFTPILATYKYRFPVARKLTVNFGASAGATKERAKAWWVHENETTFTFGLVGGVSYALTEHVSLEGNALVLRLGDTDIATDGNIAIVTAGVSFRF